MIGLTQAERPYLLESRHWRQIASPLVLGAKQVDRLHRQPEMQGKESRDAGLDTAQLHHYESCPHRTHRPTSVISHIMVGHEVECRDLRNQLERKLATFPV
jgi:hypothetical protein